MDNLKEAQGLLASGDVQKAAERFRDYIHVNSDHAEAHLYLGEALFRLNRKEEALAAFQRAYRLDASLGGACFWLGLFAEKMRNPVDAISYYKKSIACSKPHRRAFIQLASIYHGQGKALQSLQTIMAGEGEYPDDQELTFIRGRLAATLAPLWHLPMLADQERNDAYDRAIKEIVRPGDIVLDIGTGSGLLAMMAARAGAAHVYACEADTVLAEMANTIVAKNGFGDLITIVPKSSLDMRVGIDMPEAADVLVTEIFDNAFVGEGVLPTLKHARASLMKPDARYVPDQAVLYGTLSEASHLRAFHTCGDVSGFDLSDMSALAHPLSYKDLEIGSSDAVKLLSETFPVLKYEFSKSHTDVFQSNARINVLQSGSADAVVMWFDLQLSPNVRFSSKDAELHQHWRRVAQLLHKPEKVEAGSSVTVSSLYDRFFEFSLSD